MGIGSFPRVKRPWRDVEHGKYKAIKYIEMFENKCLQFYIHVSNIFAYMLSFFTTVALGNFTVTSEGVPEVKVFEWHKKVSI